MQDELLNVTEDKMQKTIAVLQEEYQAIRAGRANPQLLNRVMVDYYGTPTPLPQMANISAPDPKTIVVSLWDASMLKTVEKAIMASELGIHPSNDGKVIRLLMPELTHERRLELVKTVKQKSEEAKVAVRNTRRDTLERIKKQKKESEITEDDQKIYEEKIQKLTDKYVKQIDTLAAAKEKEIMQV